MSGGEVVVTCELPFLLMTDEPETDEFEFFYTY